MKNVYLSANPREAAVTLLVEALIGMLLREVGFVNVESGIEKFEADDWTNDAISKT